MSLNATAVALALAAMNGAGNYNNLSNLPTLNDTTISGDKTITDYIGYTPVRNVHLWSDGSGVYYFDDREEMENPLTYEQIKEIVEDDTNSVFLTNGNYSFYGKYLYVPGIAGENAIGFAGATQLDRDDGRRVYSYMMVIHDDDTVTIHEIRLATYSQVVLKNQGAENAGKVLGINENGEVVPVEMQSTSLNQVEAYIGDYTDKQNFTVDYGILSGYERRIYAG